MGIASTNSYKNNFIREKYDRINLTLPKGMKAEIDQYQKEHGFRSVNDFIQAAIVESMSSGMAKSDNGEIVFPQNNNQSQRPSESGHEKEKAPPEDGAL